VAAAIGAALSAEKLLLCTGAPGILERVDDPELDHFVHRSRRPQAAARREEDRRWHVAQGQGHRRCDSRRGASSARDVVQVARSILAEVFTNEGAGTLIVADVNALSPAEQQGGK
jgi:acetylglutamate kinase